MLVIVADIVPSELKILAVNVLVLFLEVTE